MLLWYYFILIFIADFSAKCLIVRTKPNTDISSRTAIEREINGITIPIIIHLDKSITTKLIGNTKRNTRNHLKELTRNLLNQVERNFRHPSLRQRIKFKLIDTKFLKNNTKVVPMDANVTKYLRSYCQWQAEKKKKKQKWYYSVLLTGMDLYYERRGKKIRSSTGRGYMNGMCRISKSCTVIEWRSQNIEYLLTHEIGHSLGLPHDGPPYNKCKAQGYVMGAGYNPRSHPRAWSSCNRVDLKNFMTSGKGWCLRSDKYMKFLYE